MCYAQCAVQNYKKPHLSIPKQIGLLKSRGMAISDDTKAAHALERIGYYRLSGYWYPFRDFIISTGPDGRPVTTMQDNFLPGAAFSDAVCRGGPPL